MPLSGVDIKNLHWVQYFCYLLRHIYSWKPGSCLYLGEKKMQPCGWRPAKLMCIWLELDRWMCFWQLTLNILSFSYCAFLYMEFHRLMLFILYWEQFPLNSLTEAQWHPVTLCESTFFTESTISSSPNGLRVGRSDVDDSPFTLNQVILARTLSSCFYFTLWPFIGNHN